MKYSIFHANSAMYVAFGTYHKTLKYHQLLYYHGMLFRAKNADS